MSGFLPNAPVTALQLFNYAGTKTLVASTYGRGIWNYACLPTTRMYFQFAADGISDADGEVQWHADRAGRIREPGEFELCRHGASDLHAAPAQIRRGDVHLDRKRGVGDYSFNAHAVGTDPNAITNDAGSRCMWWTST